MSRTIKPAPAWPDDPIDQLVWKLGNARPGDQIFHVRREQLEAVRLLKLSHATLERKLAEYEAG